MTDASIDSSIKIIPICSDEKIALIGDLFPGPVFIYGLHSRPVLYNNDALVTTLGYSMEDVSSWNYETMPLVFNDDLEDFHDGVGLCAEQAFNKVHTFTCRLNRKLGGYNHFQLTGRAFQRDIQGNPESILFFAQDISHYVEQESTSHEVGRRNAELKRSNKGLEEFAYIASHDMHEPLRKVHSFAQRLKEKYSASVAEEGKDFLDRILASSQNARLMIDGMMEFSLLSNNEFGFEKSNMNDLVYDVLTDLELRIEETQTIIDIQKLPQIEVIPIQMKQLFSNVILNAIKFTKTGEVPHLNIQSEKLSGKEVIELNLNKESAYHRFTIRDNGIGFEKEYAEIIFQMFQRLNGKSEYTGSGIGLALCKKITDNHKGTITANGMPGEGTVITIILPEKNIQ